MNVTALTLKRLMLGALATGLFFAALLFMGDAKLRGLTGALLLHLGDSGITLLLSMLTLVLFLVFFALLWIRGPFLGYGRPVPFRDIVDEEWVFLEPIAPTLAWIQPQKPGHDRVIVEMEPTTEARLCARVRTKGNVFRPGEVIN